MKILICYKECENKNYYYLPEKEEVYCMHNPGKTLNVALCAGFSIITFALLRNKVLQFSPSCILSISFLVGSILGSLVTILAVNNMNRKFVTTAIRVEITDAKMKGNITIGKKQLFQIIFSIVLLATICLASSVFIFIGNNKLPGFIANLLIWMVFFVSIGALITSHPIERLKFYNKVLKN